jgi:peroxiredoxin
MKRSAFVVIAMIAAVTAMLWAGIMAYKIRRSMHTPPISQATLAEEGATKPAPLPGGADPNSPDAQGLKDLRGKPAPAFTLKTTDGKTVTLADYKGKAILLNFWATWCGPCKLEMPWLIDLQKQYAPQGFTVLGVSEDDGSPKDVASFAQKMGVDYPILMGNTAISHAYGGIDYLPTTFYIDRSGKVAIEVGGIVSKGEIEANIQKILASKGA